MFQNNDVVAIQAAVKELAEGMAIDSPPLEAADGEPAPDPAAVAQAASDAVIAAGGSEEEASKAAEEASAQLVREAVERAEKVLAQADVQVAAAEAKLIQLEEEVQTLVLARSEVFLPIAALPPHTGGA